MATNDVGGQCIAVNLARCKDMMNDARRDVYDGYPNPSPVGNDGRVDASGPPLDGFAASASLTVPANGALVFVKE